MAATLTLTHKAIGVEIRRGTYAVMLDGQHVGSLEMNDTYETPIEPGPHTLQVRNGRNTSRTKTFDAADDEIIAYRCTGKSILPIFLLSFRTRADDEPSTSSTGGADGCYLERDMDITGGDASILVNDDPGGSAVTILPTNKGFDSEDCGTWTIDLKFS